MLLLFLALTRCFFKRTGFSSVKYTRVPGGHTDDPLQVSLGKALNIKKLPGLLLLKFKFSAP